MSDVTITVTAPTGETMERPVSEAAYWRGKGAAVTAPQATTPLAPAANPGRVAASMHQTYMGPIAQALPSVGGFAGGLLGSFGGPPGRMIGAGFGGGAGEAGSEMLQGHPLDAGNIAKQGAGQAALQGVGEGAAKMLSLGAGTLMRGAMTPTAKLMEQFPEVVRDAIRSRMGVGQSAKAIAARGASAGQLSNGLLTPAADAGLMFDMSKIVPEGTSLVSANHPEAKGEIAAMEALRKSVLSSNPKPKSPLELNDMKRIAQNLSKNVLDAQKKGGLITPDMSQRQRFYAALAANAQKALESIPGVSEQNANTQRMIGLSRALQTAEGAQERGVPGRVPAFMPELTGRILPGMLRNRGALSGLALAASDPRVLALARQSPRLAFLLSQLGATSDQPVAAPDATAANQ